MKNTQSIVEVVNHGETIGEVRNTQNVIEPADIQPAAGFVRDTQGAIEHGVHYVLEVLYTAGVIEVAWPTRAPVIPPIESPYIWPPFISGPCRKTTLHLWQTSRAAQVETTGDRASDWTECGDPRNKFFQGVLLDADTYNADKLVAVRDSDTGVLHALEPSPIRHAGRQVQAYSFATPFLAHQVRDEPQDNVAWRRFGISYEWQPSPEAVRTWKTQRTAHGRKGYQHISRILAAYSSLDDVTLMITSWDGQSPAPLTLPSTGGLYHKVLLTLTANKGQWFEYAATSLQPFRLFLNDWVVWIGEWGRMGPYIDYHNLGGEFGDRAEI